MGEAYIIFQACLNQPVKEIRAMALEFLFAKIEGFLMAENLTPCIELSKNSEWNWIVIKALTEQLNVQSSSMTNGHLQLKFSPDCDSTTEGKNLPVDEVDYIEDLDDVDREVDWDHDDDQDSYESIDIHQDVSQDGRLKPKKKKEKCKKPSTSLPESDEPKHECLLCRKKMATLQRLSYHMAANHGDGHGFQCPLCKYRPTKRELLRSHMRKVHTERNHVCHICKKGFKLAPNLKRHVNEFHLNLRNFACDICGKKFHTQQRLDLHMSGKWVHETFTCALCHKGFMHDDYKQHVKTCQDLDFAVTKREKKSESSDDQG